ncbi:MAG: DEAD/DEAH box helicase [Gallionella sp.]|jgi:helicase
MKYHLPEHHGLSKSIVNDLVFKEDENPALTDAQYEALDAGVGRGESLLVVSPTSTGKTQIAVWAIAKGIETGCNTVYLVTHRALAKQKFDDFKSLLLDKFLDGNGSALVIATGDYVINAEGDTPTDPLSVPLLVATYEKYLALLSASGIPTDMGKTVVVCDEIQLIGDKSRGQNVEILLTMIRNAGWKQFVGLSAVLESRDANDLANWLGVTLVSQHAREKHLQYECWNHNGIAMVSSEQPENIQENLPRPTGVNLDPVSILISLLDQKVKPVPIIVFCMKKKDMYDLADQLLPQFSKGGPTQLSIVFDELPETSANTFLAKTIAHRVAIHSADLVDEERHVVEKLLKNKLVDVVFATSTLAAGVNFPLGAAIFANWERWDSDKRAYFPIESSEFHNMAGRVGRMGFEHAQGRVIFLAKTATEIYNAKRYLDLGAMPSLESRVTPQRFNQLALQLVASGLCNSRDNLEKLICTTLSALREKDRNSTSFSRWPTQLSAAIDELLDEGLLIETSTGALSVTPVGKAIGYSGLLPETGIFLLNYVVDKAERLVQYLPKPDNPGDMYRFAYLLFCTCFSSPEFRPCNGKPATRFLPWPLGQSILFAPDVFRDDLPEPVWHADIFPINAAKLSTDWVDGAEIAKLEKSLPNLSAGMLGEMFRNLVWALQGFSAIITASADLAVHNPCRPKVLRNADDKVELLRKLPRVIQRLGIRVAEGLPDDALWMTSLNTPNAAFRLSRHEIIALRRLGYSTPEHVMLSSPEASEARMNAFAKIKPAPQAKANWLRDACRDWKLNQRKRAAEKHVKRARSCANIALVGAYYNNKGTDFEQAFEAILNVLDIQFEQLDDKTKTGAPDYLVLLKDSPALIFELKSKQGDSLVDYNKATEVLTASEIHGHRDTFCVTLCHPGVDPSVPMVIAACGRLSVVESHDLGEALLRICEGKLTQNQLWHWLASPGQALIADLPFREYV